MDRVRLIIGAENERGWLRALLDNQANNRMHTSTSENELENYRIDDNVMVSTAKSEFSGLLAKKTAVILQNTP